MNDIEYRKCLVNKKEKLTLDEKKWLATNPLYNENLGCSILRADCITIDPNLSYLVNITLIHNNSLSRITPTILVPLRKGYIKAFDPVYNIDHVTLPKNKAIYVLSTCNSNDHPTSLIEYRSDLGCIEISFDCEIADHRGFKYWGSSKMVRGLGMQREQISDSKIIYRCNDVSHTTFDSYVFSVEWNKI